MFASGFISLWRSILDWEWYDDINTTRLYIHLMLTVSFKDDTWHGIEVKRGSRVSSLEVLSNETNLTVRQVRTALKHLEKTGEVTRLKYAKFTVFTLNNYDKYQGATSKLTDNRQGNDKQNGNLMTECRQGSDNNGIKYNKDNKKINNNISSAPQNDMYNTDYDFGYIPDGKDF
jgi:hypothetical protein